MMLSRVQCVDQVFILKKFEDKKIKTSKMAMNELQRLRDISFNKNPSSWHKTDEKSVKIATVHCAGLLAHYRDLKKDHKLLVAHQLHLLETSLAADSDTEVITLDGFSGQFLNIGKGKGIATFIRNGISSVHKEDIIHPTLQVIKYHINGIDVLSLIHI